MKEIFKISKTVFKYDEEKKCLYQYWGYLTPEIYKKAHEQLLKLSNFYKIEKVLSITPNNNLIRAKDIKWSTDIILPKLIKNGLRYLILILSNDQTNEIIVKKIIRQVKSTENIIVKEFEFLSEAEEWLDSIPQND